jgi:hypothetical protein
LNKGLPAVIYLGDVAKPLEFDDFNEPEEKTDRPADDQEESGGSEVLGEAVKPPRGKVPPKADEYEWVWKVCPVCDSKCFSLMNSISQPELETSRRTFFLLTMLQ